MLSVANKSIMLSVIMLNVVILSVVMLNVVALVPELDRNEPSGSEMTRSSFGQTFRFPLIEI